MGHDVTLFTPYPFKAGQKIRIEEGRRRGDWEVVEVGEHKVTLKCPISHKEFSWTNFCYFTEIKENTVWPIKD